MWQHAPSQVSGLTLHSDLAISLYNSLYNDNKAPFLKKGGAPVGYDTVTSSKGSGVSGWGPLSAYHLINSLSGGGARLCRTLYIRQTCMKCIK